MTASHSKAEADAREARSKPARIVFEAHWWAEGPPSGRMVLRESVRAWLSSFPDDEVHLVLPRRDVDAALPAGCIAHYVRSPVQAFTAAVQAPNVARRVRADAVFCHNFAPLRGRRRGVFIHDVLFRTDPSWFTRAERAYLAPIVPLARLADVVLTSSTTERERIKANTKARDVVATGLAVGTNLSLATEEEPRDAPRGRFVLAVGRLNARKNLGVLLEAAAQLADCGELVVVGEEDGQRERLGPAAVAALEQGTVRMLGAVSDAELRWLYSRAQALAFPSLNEGFGLPAIEALTFGCPVIVSDIPTFRETVGDCATFVAPRDVDAWAVALRRALLHERSTGAVDGILAQYAWPRVVGNMRQTLLKSEPHRD